MDVIVKPMEWGVAVRKLSGRTPVGSALRTEGWSRIPLALRERAFFSAGVQDARELQRLQDLVGSAKSKSEFVAKAREYLRSRGHPAPGDERDLAALTSRRRLELIHGQNLEAARGHGWWKEGQRPEVLDAFPAQEFLRVESRQRWRMDWPERWRAAGGRMFGSRMIALKNSGVWTALSRFGVPWPPFDFGSGMGVADVSREEATALGVIQPGEVIQGDEANFNERMEASVKGLSRESLDLIELAFGDQVKVANGMAKWVGKVSYTDWKEERMQSATQWTVEAVIPPRIDQEEGRRRLSDGFTVVDAQGRRTLWNRKTLDHWKGYADEAIRPSYLPAAVAGVQQPSEIWEQADQMAYLTVFKKQDRGGYSGVAVFVGKEDGQTRTYYLRNPQDIDKIRRGIRRVYP